jgi:hypothetical protein
LFKIKIRHVDSSAKGDDSFSLRSIVLILIPWQEDIVVAGDVVVELPVEVGAGLGMIQFNVAAKAMRLSVGLGFS